MKHKIYVYLNYLSLAEVERLLDALLHVLDALLESLLMLLVMFSR